MTSSKWMDAARIRLEAATVLLEQGFPADALNRAYYAVFSSAKELLMSRGLGAKTHRGVHTLLHEYYQEVIDTALFRALQEEREDCDYRLLKPSKSKAEQRIQQARSFVETAVQLRNSDEDNST